GRPGPRGAEAPPPRHYHSLVTLAAALNPAFDGAATRVIVVTSAAESVLDEPVRHPEGALAGGPVIAPPPEVPPIRLGAGDLAAVEGAEAAEAAARQLVAEAAAGDHEDL